MIETANYIIEAFKMYFVLSTLDEINTPIHVRISQQANLNPHNIAVKHGNKELFYYELEQQSNTIANTLVGLGLKKEDCIGIHLTESILLPIVTLGILKAGCTYVPIAVDLPKNRLQSIIENAEISLVFTNLAQNQLESFDDLTVIALDENLSSIKNPDITLPEIEIAQNHAAYIIYTSGSTGDPKGVVVEHKSLAHYLSWYLDDLQSQTNINLPLTSSISFAAGVTQLFSALLLGKTLHIINRETVKSPPDLLNWYAENPDFGLYCVPTLWEEVINYTESQNTIPPAAPKCLYLSGEALSKSLADRTFKLWPEISIWNLYGPTEATANVSYYEVQNGKEIFLGKPIRGAKIIILDEELNPVPKGEEGYIYVASLALARSYKNKEELTQKSFIQKHQVNGYEGFAIYNTGDLGKFDDNNELVFLGRKDQQVKIRGYRIELSEVEKCLNGIPGIRQVACKETLTNAKKNQITAFIVANEGVTVNTLRAQLADYLPDYMIPESFVFLDQMPKLANGKINRKLLELDDTQERPKMSYNKVEALNQKEETMLRIWEDVLDMKGLGMNDDFFDLGGNSLKIIKLVNTVNTVFTNKIEFCEVWNNTTPLSLLNTIENKIPNVATESEGLIKNQGTKKTVPLTFNQTGMWFILQSRPDQTAYNMLFTINLEGITASQNIKKALELTIQKHDVLHSRFKTENNSPVREILDDYTLDFSVLDFSIFSKEEQINNEAALKNDLLNRNINLSEDHLISFRLVKYSNQKQILFVPVHHIVFDGVSINLFTTDFYNAYNQIIASQNQESNTSFQLEYSYSDYEQWFKKNYFNGSFSKSEEFWKKKLENGNYFLNFPIDTVRPKIQSYEGKNKELVIEGSILQKLEAFNKTHKLTSFITLLAVFKTILHRYTNENDILVGVPFANRANKGTDSIIGLFVNTVVFRTEFTPETTFIDLVKAIKNYTFEAIEHQNYPFEKVVEKLNPERSISYNPLFQVMFAYHDKLKDFTAEDGTVLQVNEIQNQSCKFDLDIEAQENKDSIVVNFNYNTSLFEAFTIESIMQQFLYLLEEAVTIPENPITQYLLEKPEVLQNKLTAWNDTTCNYDSTVTHSYLEYYAVHTPSAIAVQTDDAQITYAELNEKANRLALYLIEKGVKNDDVIGIITERSVEMMIAVFAVLKAGGAYLPIDPSVPVERIKYMVADSSLSLILTKKQYADQFDLNAEFILIDEYDSYRTKPAENPVKSVKPNHLAYVIYTSGSTGNPKGVMIEHHSLINRINWMQKSYPLTTEDVIMQKTPYTFDVSVWELFWWSFVGAKVHLLEVGGEKNPEVIIKTIQNQNISTMHFVPSLFHIFLEYTDDYKINLSDFKSLEKIFTSGEALEKHHVEKFYNNAGKDHTTQLINLYGPTEATIDVSYFDCSQADDYSKVPIGKPIDNTQLYILDPNNQPLPERIPGELCIAGVGLARGYLNNPKLTAERFIDAEFNQTRMYKTGDLARWLPDGNIEFLGRIDHQVKIRGFRIELGEIENCLNKHPNVETAVAVTKEIGYNDTRIITYCILKEESVTVDFKSHLRSFLPEYMIPSAFVTVEQIPLLSNGKLDIKSLPEPFAGKSQVIGAREYNNQYERGLAKIWTSILQHDAFSLDDNFYDVGGYSFLLLKMKSIIDTEFKTDIRTVDLFQYPTIRSLAEIIATKNVSNQKSTISDRAQLQRKLIQKLKDKKS
jgi:amino acid adenylation domain-containing protein